MAADGNGDFARALGLEMDGRAFGMGQRSQRFDDCS
jgi:peroxiredoxin